jgi:hypothetical protein
MTKEQKLVLADRLMNIEFKHSPVTGSRNSLRVTSVPGVGGKKKKSKKFTEKEIAGIRAFYLTGPNSSAAATSARHPGIIRKSNTSATKPNSKTTMARTVKVGKAV